MGDFSEKANIVASAAVQPKAQVVYMDGHIRWDSDALAGEAAAKEATNGVEAVDEEATLRERLRFHSAKAPAARPAAEGKADDKAKAEAPTEEDRKLATTPELARRAIQKPVRQVVLVFVEAPAKAGAAAEISADMTEPAAPPPAEK